MEFFSQNPGVTVFLIGQLLSLIYMFIRWYISHDRMRTRITIAEKNMELMEAKCGKCKDSTASEIGKVRADFEDDLKEIRRDMKDMNTKLEQIPMIYLSIEKLRSELFRDRADHAERS